MEKSIIISIILFSVLMGHAQQVEREIVMTQAGTLSTLLPAEERCQVEKLTICGPMNGSDLMVLHDILDEFARPCSLEYLDLSKARLNGGQWGGSALSPNVIPYGMLAWGGRLRTFIFPEEIVEIGGNAFYMCSGMQSLDIPGSVISIGEQAFYYCRGLKYIIMHSMVPPSCESMVFGGMDTGKIPLYVPTGSKQSYVADKTFSIFSDIREYDETAGVVNMQAEKKKITNADVIYDLQGQKAVKVKSGIYITNGRKMVIK